MVQLKIDEGSMGCMGKSNLNLKAVVNKRSSPSTFHFYVQEK